MVYQDTTIYWDYGDREDVPVMDVAVVVLSCLGSLEAETAVTLLGIGLACAGAAMLAKQ